MGEAPEAVDHRLVAAGEGQRAGHVAGKDLHAQALVGPVLAMHQRHGEELDFLAGHGAVPAPAKRRMAERQRERVGGERFRSAAEQVARHLVEQDDCAQRRGRIDQEFARRTMPQPLPVR